MSPQGHVKGVGTNLDAAQRVPLKVSADADSEAGQTDDTSVNQPPPVCKLLKKHKWRILLLFVGIVLIIAVFIIAFFIGQVRCGDVVSKQEEMATPPSNATRSSKGHPPPEWVWHDHFGYYYSKETLNWLASKKFCEDIGATLAVLEDNQLKKNVIRFKTDSDDHWYGRYKMDGELKWLTESLVEDEKLNQISGQNCGALNPGEELVADCSSEKPFICISPLS